ncbi:glycine betaine ABC transporter substrate-binding protein [Ornithinimicrobium sp. F0845]|uniref:glycine betaine ABC transporter substrate-binding protein n=1 Tax=Ornithinimicrobium sp. F0845 TaxID=2926412 RepID=UPI001FF23217|nr:glycine betaine ABC transporter substrate-binding protein [Ornithinimicrobium sp. F0845]MCK0110707.1 glycine betaine ABC transporter substrate-binding protein [Ornithinimicrobium sp. F0845]
MRLQRNRRAAGVITSALALSLILGACGSEDGGDSEGTEAEAEEGAGDDGSEDMADDSADTEAAGGEASGTITLGFIPSWTDGLSTAYLLEHLLTEEGYDVEMQTLTEAALLYSAVANGDVDMYPSAWPEATHADYMEEYGDRIEDLGSYYDNAKLTFAVPTYSDIESIADLPDHVDELGGEIIGIEPGAGLTRTTKESVMPAYGLDDFTLVESSTTAMLAQLKDATDNEEPIVVTLWKPFWANSAFPVKDLEDPEGALGEPEALHFLATEGFSEEFPQAAEIIGSIKLNDEQYGALEDMVVNEFGEGNEAEAIDAWLEEFPDVIPAS